MTEYVEALLQVERLRDALERIRKWPECTAGIIECELTNKHIVEWHDMGGRWYCSRCQAGTCVHPIKLERLND